MSRYPEYHRLSAVISAAARLAFHDSGAKRLAQLLGCSIITGKRIAAQGRVSPAWRGRLVTILRQELARNRQALEEIDAELKDMEHAEKVAAAAAVRSALMGSAADAGGRAADGPAQPKLTGAERGAGPGEGADG